MAEIEVSTARKLWADLSFRTFQARRRHKNINVLVRLVLGRSRVCPWDKPGLSLGQKHGVEGRLCLFRSLAVGTARTKC